MEKLYTDLKELHGRMDRVTAERNESLDKYAETEKYWRLKQAKSDREYQALFELNQSVKEDNSALLDQLDKFNRRIKQLEAEAARESEVKAGLAARIEDLMREGQAQDMALEAARADTVRERREQERLREEHMAEVARHAETKDLLKKCEEKCTQLYQEVINQSKTGVERWTDIQRRYEDTQALLARQCQINEDLQGKLAEYKSLNS